MTKKDTPNLFCRVTDTHIHRQIFNQYSGISSHSFGCLYTLKKVYTQLISALNDVRIKKSNSTLSALWNGKPQNTYIDQVKASSVVVKCDDIDFFDWSLHNSRAYFWSCDDIGKCPMLRGVIERAIEKSPHYKLAGNLFNADHEIHQHQFVGFVSSYTRFNVLTLFVYTALSHTTRIQTPILL
jgi:hypothetical protein